MAIGAMGLLLIFVIGELRRGDGALVPMTLFSTPTVVGLNLVTLLLYGSLGALLVLVPYVLIEALQCSHFRSSWPSFHRSRARSQSVSAPGYRLLSAPLSSVWACF
jgi:hypothetical protein